MSALVVAGDVVIRRARRVPRGEREFALQAFPGHGRSSEVSHWKSENLRNVMRGWDKIVLARREGIPTFFGCLWVEVNGVDYGLVSTRMVTDAGVAAIASGFVSGGLNSFKYHGLGTGTAAEAVTDVQLQSELTTEYFIDNERPAATNSSTAGVFESNVDIIVDAPVSATEHGLFSALGTGTGGLLDRSVFAAITMAAGDLFRATYQLTISSGG